MALEPRRKSKLAGRHPAAPEPAEPDSNQQHHERDAAVTSSDEEFSRGRAELARPDAVSAHPGVGRAGSGSREAEPENRDPTGDNRESESGRRKAEGGTPDPGPESRVATPASPFPPSGQAGAPGAGAGRRVQWTQDAKTVRAELTAWVAALRKADLRAAEARRLIEDGAVPGDQARVIVRRVADQTGMPVAEVAAAAGVDPTDIDD